MTSRRHTFEHHGQQQRQRQLARRGTARGATATAARRAGPTGGAGPADVSERNPRMYANSDALEAALNMRAQAQPGPLAEQEARAMQEFVQALNNNTAALDANTAVGTVGSFTPQAGENG